MYMYMCTNPKLNHSPPWIFHLLCYYFTLWQHPSLCDHVLLRELYLDENSLSDVTAITKAWLPLLQTLSLSNNWYAIGTTVHSFTRYSIGKKAVLC